MTKNKHIIQLLVIILLSSSEVFSSDNNKDIEPVYSKSQIDSIVVQLRQDMKTEIKNDVILE